MGEKGEIIQLTGETAVFPIVSNGGREPIFCSKLAYGLGGS